MSRAHNDSFVCARSVLLLLKFLMAFTPSTDKSAFVPITTILWPMTLDVTDWCFWKPFSLLPKFDSLVTLKFEHCFAVGLQRQMDCFAEKTRFVALAFSLSLFCVLCTRTFSSFFRSHSTEVFALRFLNLLFVRKQANAWVIVFNAWSDFPDYSLESVSYEQSS